MTSDEQAPIRFVFAALVSRLSRCPDRIDARAYRLTLVLCSSAVVLSGCAAQSPPRPPRLQRPVTVNDLAVSQVGRTLQLRFTAPSEAIDGESLTKPLEIQIFRTVSVPSAAGASAASAPGASIGGIRESTPFATLGSDELARFTVGEKVEYGDELPLTEFGRFVGATFRFQVRGLTRGFRGRPVEGDLSNVASLKLFDVPIAATGLSIVASQSALTLHWSAPTETMSGRSAGFVTSYRVYRRDAGKPASFRYIGLAHGTSYDDTDFEFGQHYAYKVRSVLAQLGLTAESEDSAVAEISPLDTFPPAAPAGLTGLYTAGGVELIWTPNLESDLAGYNVYRRQAGGAADKLNAELLRSPRYIDSAASPGQKYTYQVTAVDRSGNESAYSSETMVGVP